MDYKHLITANAEIAKIEERLPSYFVEGQAQHVIQRGNNRDLIFANEKDYLFYLECLSEAATQHKLMINAMC
jgi:putative transposase